MEKEMAETLVRTGPGTPMGNLMRRYWVPVMGSNEIAEPDGPQQRVQILGEKLIAFRDSEGQVGLIDEFCSHRGASLYFGRNEEGGIRCSYHGLKFTRDGTCVDVPSGGEAISQIERQVPTCDQAGQQECAGFCGGRDTCRGLEASRQGADPRRFHHHHGVYPRS